MTKQERITVRRILRLLHYANIHPVFFLVPVTLSLLAAFFEGISMSLLIPLLNGFLIGDYSFVKETPLLAFVLSYLPDIITSRDASLFGFLAGFFLIAVVSKVGFKFGSSLTLLFGSVRAIHHVRKELFARYLRFGKLFFDTTSVGHHNNVLIEQVGLAFTPLLRLNVSINALFSLIAYLVIMCFISWKLTLFAIPLFLLMNLCLKGIIVAIDKASFALTEQSTELSKKIVDILSVMSLVKSANTEAAEQAHFSDMSDEQSKLKFKMGTLKMTILPTQEVITLFAALTLFCGMLYLSVLRGESTPTSFIVYFYLVYNSAGKLSQVFDFRGQLAMASGPAEHVLAIFDDDDKHWVPDGTEAFTGLQQGITFDHAAFTFPGNMPVLTDLSFTADKGKTTAIVGPTGAGKSTIINLILRFYDLDANMLLLDGKDIRSFTAASVREHIAFVSQDTLLIHDTLKQNITYGMDDVSDDQIQEALRKARLADFVDTLPEGVETIIGDHGVKLSGGEKQRVGLARAFLQGVDILMLDEATSALDTTTEKLILEAIDELSQDKTVLVIAHRLSTIQQADTIVVLKDGVCAEQGTHSELLKKKGVFYELWQQQLLDITDTSPDE